MNIKKSILSCLLMLGFVSASAQEPEMKTEYVFNPHWYVQVQPLGGQYTLGELSFSDMLSYNAQVAVGYQFDKVFGARLAVNAWQSKGGSDYENDGGEFSWKWKYVAPTIDLTANLSNLFYGFNPQRVFNLGLFVGVGANIAFDNDEAATAAAQIKARHAFSTDNAPMTYLWDGTKPRFVAQAGLTGDFRLSDKVSIGLEVNANTLSDRYNSKKARNADWYFNALAGVKINLGPTYTTRQVKGCEPRIVEKVVEKVVEKPVYIDKIVEVEKKAEPLRRDVFFTINSSRIDPTETQKIVDVVNYLNANPNAKVTITGYADKGTGNAQINERLGKNRAKVVTDRLVKQYKIDPARIITDSKGDTEQPFAENDKNRVSICIAE
ncbi:MAG: OmpA family protein [Prevotella sp.]|nr:OmpA family protein [Prevotella sp.]